MEINNSKSLFVIQIESNLTYENLWSVQKRIQNFSFYCRSQHEEEFLITNFVLGCDGDSQMHSKSSSQIHRKFFLSLCDLKLLSAKGLKSSPVNVRHSWMFSFSLLSQNFQCFPVRNDVRCAQKNPHQGPTEHRGEKWINKRFFFFTFLGG